MLASAIHSLGQYLLHWLQQPYVTGAVLPLSLTGAVALWKASSKPLGPRPDDRALGFDLLFAAVGSEFSYMTTTALLPMPEGVHSEILAWASDLNITLIDKSDLGTWLLILLLIASGLLVLAMRFWGYQPNGRDLHEIKGVALPTILGIVLLLSVYAVNTMAPSTSGG